MRTRSITLTLVAALALTAARPPAEGGEGGLEQLVRQLASPRYAQRQAAARKLEALGEQALPALRRVAGDGDLEVRRRATQLIEAIERRAEAARLLAGRRVRVNVQGGTVADAVQQLRERAGLRDIDLAVADPAEEAAQRTLTLDTGETTFWEALDRLCAEAGLTLQPVGDTRLARGPFPGEGESLLAGAAGAHFVRLLDRQGKAAPTCRVGNLRISALPTNTARRPQQLATRSGETGFVLEVRAEPRVGWQGITRVRITRAIDDRGQRLAQPAVSTSEWPGARTLPNGVAVWDAMTGQPVAPTRTAAPVRLTAGKLPSALLKEVEGIVTVRLQTVRPLLTVDDVARAEGKTVRDSAGRYAKVVQVSRAAGATVVRVQVQMQAAGETPFQVVRNHRGVVWMRGGDGEALGEMAMLDAKGTVLAKTSRRALIPNPGGPGLLLEFHLRYTPAPGTPEPSRLVCSGPATVAVDVPFTLRNVPVSPEALPDADNPHFPALGR